MGDFNEVRKQPERYDSIFNVQGADAFNSFISAAGLEEVPLGGCSFTWCHKSATKMSKLDRFLISKGLTDGSQHVELENNVTREEVKRVVWDCGADKSPGPNGFIFGFYRRYWIFLEKDVEEADEVDFKKAYDSVRWDYLDDVLKKFGFGDRWCGWIQSYLRSSRGSVIVNGSPTREFQFHKGLKQGNPLSLLLFILIMERLHILVQRVVDAGMFRVQVLECFYRASSLRINMNKSKIIRISMAIISVDQVAAKIGCATLEAPFSYLGSKKPIWVKWSKVLASKEKGVLGVSSFYALNKALLFKWVWPFRTQGSSLWVRVIKRVQDIARGMKQLKNHDIDLFGFIHKRMGNRADTSFWEDVWRGDGAFKSLYPRIYALEICKNVTIVVKMSHENMEYSFHQSPRGGIEWVQFLEFFASMEGVALVDMRDMLVWSLEGSREFLVAYVRRLINERWIKPIPPCIIQENQSDFVSERVTTDNEMIAFEVLHWLKKKKRGKGGPVTTEEKVQKKNDVKARSMLLMALPNEHLMNFNQYKDSQTLFAAIQIRFGGNKAIKKTQKTLLKQMYENFNAPSTESLDFIFNRLQKIWNTHVVVWRNKPDLDIMSFDDLYNNFKIVKQKVKRTTSLSSSSSSQNMAFVSSPSSTNAVNTAYGVSTANTQVSPANTQVSTASTQVSTANLNDIEEMDLKWQLALLSMRTRKFFQKTGRKITINGSDTTRYDKSKVECFNCHKMRHFARECRGPRNQDSRNRNQDNSRRTVNVEETSSKAMVVINGAGFDWSYMADNKVPTNMALIAFSDSELTKSEFNLATYKRGLASVEEQLVFYKKNEVIFCEQLAVLKRDISYKDSEISMLKSELEKLKQEKESNQLKIKKFDNASKSLDKLIGSQITDKSRKGVGFVSYNVVPPPPTGLFSPLNLDLSYSGLEEFQQLEFEGYGPQTSKSVSEDISNGVRESPDAPLVKELVSDDKLEKKTAFPTVAKIEFVKAKPQEKPVRKPVKYAKMYRSQTPRADCNYHQRERPKAVNTARLNSAVVNVVRANQVNVVKALACWVWRPTKLSSASITLKRHNYVKARCRSKHMTGNMSYLLDFKEFDGGCVTFGGGAKGEKITGKGTFKTGKLDFEDVYFVKELHFNLFSVSHMCDKKNSVLFTDTGCFVLSPDFKLADESQVLLKVHRKNNMYIVDINNIVPKECLTCLVAKATLDESMLWHRRLGHVSFKTFNKNFKENLVRGLPLKHFENDQTCVACLKGKQHKASCKSKIQNSITQPLFKLHMDLFGPTFVSSLMNKKYYLVAIDDYSRFTWVFFLETKDETSGILKRFITEIENLVDNKNRVLVVKPHNKTPYELFRGRTPALSFMRPFGCHVTILNTLDYLGTFDGKSDEGFFVGYSMNSKAFRVYNIRTMKVEENLYIRFLEDKPIIAGDGPKWLFEIDVLTKSMNYVPVVAGTNSKDLVDGSLFDSSSKNASNDEPQPFSDAGKKDDEGVNKESGIDDQERPKNSTQDINTGQSSVQTRRMTNTTNEQGFISAVFEGKPHEDLHTCLFACFLSQEEPKKTLVDLPHSKRAIGTKWVYMNKKYERGIVIRNKARLVALSYTQEEGIDYDEVFALVARIKAIRLFLAHASFKDFVVYQMDVKSTFLYGEIEEEVYVCQPPGFEDPEFPDRVYKVEKALYGLHQAPKAWHETLSTKKELCTEFKKLMDKKFQMSSIASTPMETSKPLMKDENAKDVDIYLYRSMIGSFMYLTSLRTDIMFVVCACVRFQVTPKVSHLHAMKRIFRYLKGQPKLDLWYPKDSPFDLEAYTDSDYAGASLDRKSTTGERELVRIKIDDGNAFWNEIGVNVGDSVNVARPTLTTANKLEESDWFEGIIDFLNASSIRYTLTVNPTIYTSCIKQFWATTKAKTVNGEVQIQALVDGKKVIITETSVRRALQLKYAEGTECLPNATIFEQLTLMGYENLTQKLTFYKAFFSPQWKFLMHTILQCLSAKTTAWNEFISTMASAVICLATNQKFNFSKYIFDNVVKILEGGEEENVFLGELPPLFQTMMVQAPEELGEGSEIPTDPQHTPTIIQSYTSQPQKKQPRRKQRKDTEVPQPSGSTEPITDEAANAEHVPTHSNDPLFSEITKLKERVKKLERRNKSRTSGLKSLRKVGRSKQVVSSEDEVDEAQGRNDDYLIATTTTVNELTLAQTLIKIKAAKPKAVTTAVTRPKARGIVVQEPSEFRTTTSSSQRSQAKDKGKAKMIELEKPLKKKDQILIDEEIAQKLQAQLNAKLEEEEKLAKQREEDANIAKWDNVQAMIDANYELAARL
ncbi:putative ribonuclease H-like domain-containing protein [Tanacetum coccineum]